MPDLVVTSDLDVIRDGLKILVDEFAGALDFENDSVGIWGQHNAESSMGDFADNWTIHRDKMTERMKKLKDTVEKVAEQWRDADDKLSEAFQQ
ncbi:MULTISPECIES: hypothetical protein [unclassified Frankia]|uniref:hypothetical protein n=1 Tax=unclassified Frankia TaxID=2632575 RepID=UPI001EF3F498|nr:MULTISPECIES: hypothetical protein [unclassified Frankia]